MKISMAFTSAVLALCFAAATAVAGDVYVRGYVKKDGTYVQPHYRSSPNSTTLDNWSTRGNINPYTSKRGTRDPYADVFKQPRNTVVSPYPAQNYDAYGNRLPGYQ